MTDLSPEDKKFNKEQGAVGAIYAHILDPAIDSLQAFIEDDLPSFFENIPILKFFYGFYKAGIAIRDRIFIRKLTLMLTGISDIPKSDKEKWIEKLEEDDRKKEFGEKLIMTIEMLDDYAKAILLGRALHQYILGRVDRKMFNRICRSIQFIDIENIESVCIFYKYDAIINDDIMHNVATAGLVNLFATGKTLIGQMSMRFACSKNELGSYFCEHIAKAP